MPCSSAPSRKLRNSAILVPVALFSVLPLWFLVCPRVQKEPNRWRR